MKDDGSVGYLQQLRKVSSTFVRSIVDGYDRVIQNLTCNRDAALEDIEFFDKEIAKYRKIRDSKTPTGQTKETEKK